MFYPKPPFGMVGKKQLALLLAGGAIAGGKYLYNKWKEKQMPKNPIHNSRPINFDEPSPFGTMESSSGENISLKSVKVSGTLEGLLFSSTITQEYKNETANALEIIYTFPVGWNTALLGMDATIGEKKLHGEVVKKAEAEEQYEEAIEKGDSAIMVQQSSLGLYTANLGNIKPGETVFVEIHCAKLLGFDQGRIRLAIPTVIGERYGNEHCPGGLAPHETARVDKNASYDFSLSLQVKGSLAAAEIECPTHAVQTEKTDNSVSVSLDSNAYLDLDFVLLIKGLSGESFAQYSQDQDKWMGCASFCPKMENVDANPLGLKILVDCSGSMSGMSIKQAQKGLQNILKLLSENDYASYSKFGSDVEHLTKSMLKCESANMQKLFAAIDATDANMGGTEMEKAVLSTIRDIKQNGDVPPVLLLITDGDIWEVKSLIEGAKKTGHRIFVIGVGAAPAESVLINLANETGGACEFVTENENMAEAIVRMFHRMRGKASKNVRIEWGDKPVWQSELPKFVYDGETVHAFALFDNVPKADPVLFWTAGESDYSAKTNGMEKSDNKDMVRIGRSKQMQEVPSNEEKTALALKYQLVSDLTSLILVYERAENEKAKGLPKIQQVPQMPAYGHGNYQSLNKMGICNAFAMTSGGIISMNLCEPIIRQAPGIADETYDELFTFWKEKILLITSLAEFINLVKQDKRFASIVKELAKLKIATGFPEENVWANFLAKILESKGLLERHDKRLLNQYLYSGKDKQKFENALYLPGITG